MTEATRLSLPSLSWVLFTHEEKVSFVEDTFPESETPCPP